MGDSFNLTELVLRHINYVVRADHDDLVNPLRVDHFLEVKCSGFDLGAVRGAMQ